MNTTTTTTEQQTTSTNTTPTSITATLSHWILTRHSTRKFLKSPIPPLNLIRTSLQLAQHSPSNSNIQPWRLTIVHGKALTRLTTALVSAASKETPQIPPLPKKFAHYRRNLGALVYGAPGYGLAHDDLEGRKRAVLKNYEFFDAPIGIVVCMDRSLGAADSLSVGMFLQSFLLALAERGVQSCVEVSIAGYPEIVRRELGIEGEMEVLCGVAVGWEDG
ncbi:hypothetical protein HYFRA_00005529, partial [Hymenoscyphus fraxineus]